jgi:hypothetical protein
LVAWHRKLVVYILLAILIYGHVYDVARSKENWPISSYPMYAMAQTQRTLRVVRLIGVTSSNPREVTVNATYLQNTLSIWQQGNQMKHAKMKQAAREFLLNHNRQREKNPKVGPKLSAIRVYEFSWKLDPKKDGLGEPDQRRLLAEVSAKKPTTKPVKKPTTTSSKKKKKKKPATQPTTAEVKHVAG